MIDSKSSNVMPVEGISKLFDDTSVPEGWFSNSPDSDDGITVEKTRLMFSLTNKTSEKQKNPLKTIDL